MRSSNVSQNEQMCLTILPAGKWQMSNVFSRQVSQPHVTQPIAPVEKRMCASQSKIMFLYLCLMVRAVTHLLLAWPSKISGTDQSAHSICSVTFADLCCSAHSMSPAMSHWHGCSVVQMMLLEKCSPTLNSDLLWLNLFVHVQQDCFLAHDHSHYYFVGYIY